ncbi:MAG TPA: phage tail sheath subtilisin-like domain-containing protein [Kofleriaceae bacterium]|nr:phage tail sheath subtilisin-like domain-containing protein [Kofleriaceae bacterium]
MRSSTKYLPPGVYAEHAPPARGALEVADTHVVGFVGLAQRGPLDAPRRVTSWDEYVAIYGDSFEHYLTPSVEAFFRNGGRACHVMRVTHVPAAGEAAGPEHAACAAQVVVDDWKKPTFRVHAESEGKWGNNIWVSFAQKTGARGLLTEDLEVGAGEAHVAHSRRFEVGALVKIYDREGADYVILTEVGDRVLKWSSETPVTRVHRASSPTHVEVVELEIHAALRDRREVFQGLQLHPSSVRYAPRVIAAQSRLIRLEDLGSNSPPPHNIPVPAAPAKLTGGQDGASALSPEDFLGHDLGPGQRTGLCALAAVEEVAVLACPDAMVLCAQIGGPEGELCAQRVQDAMVDTCERLQDRVALVDGPNNRDVEVVKRWRARLESSYCAMYWPWIDVPGRGGGLVRLPASGIMAGVLAGTELAHGAHRAPANVPIVGVVGMSVPVTEDDLGHLMADGINSFRANRGLRPWGARTASSDPDWRYLNVRRLFIMLRRSIQAGMSWVPFEPHDASTWAALEDMVGLFLGDLFQRGMFAGGKIEEAFYVRCNEETNPPENVSKGLLTCDIGVAPSLPAELLMISVVQQMASE